MSIFAKSVETHGDSPDQIRRENSPVRTWSSSEPSGEISIVGRGVRVEGDIHVQGDVRVGGRINGAVYVQERIVVAAEGIILGGIEAGEGDIAGNVEGDISIQGRLVIRKSASIMGSITAEHLVVEEGAAIEGACRVGKPSRIQQTGPSQPGDGAAEGIPTLLPFEEGGDPDS